MKILVVNAGSSSLKYQLIDMEGEKVIAKGLVERIGMPQPGHQKQTVAGKVYEVSGVMIEDHVQACTMMLKALQDIPRHIGDWEKRVADNEVRIEQLADILTAVWPKEDELKKARTELGILDRKIAEDLKKTEQQEAGRQAA